MNYGIKLGSKLISSSSQSSLIFCTTSNCSSFLASKSSFKGGASVRFVQANTATHPNNNNNNNNKRDKFTSMDAKKAEEKDKTLNMMEESFGEAYATRCDEEGFGGVYGGNDEDSAEMKIVQDPAHHDSTQGSKVKEEEAARNQAKAN